MRNRYLYLSCWAAGLNMAAVPAIANEQNLSPSAIRTLKNAVTVLSYGPHLQKISQQCTAEVLQYLPVSTENGDPFDAVAPLFLQKLNIRPLQLKQLLDQNTVFSELTKPESINTPSCHDRDALLDVAEQYSNNLTALELSEPLVAWQQFFAPPTKAAAMDPAKLQALLLASHSQVLVEVKPKQLLTPIQQANYLHIDDKSSYIFEVQQGWQAISPRYLGLHIHLTPDNYQRYPNQWLLLLDANFHPKTVLHGAQMQQALLQLGTAGWSFNRQGDLLRAD